MHTERGGSGMAAGSKDSDLLNVSASNGDRYVFTYPK
jgi:hypothetical protein